MSSRDEVCVTDQKKPILGIQTTVVHHRSFENHVLVENTFDWFAQDSFANVWHFGEDTTEFPSGSAEESWEAGANDADAGLVMGAHPQVGDRYYQEFAQRGGGPGQGVEPQGNCVPQGSRSRPPGKRGQRRRRANDYTGHWPFCVVPA